MDDVGQIVASWRREDSSRQPLFVFPDRTNDTSVGPAVWRSREANGRKRRRRTKDIPTLSRTFVVGTYSDSTKGMSQSPPDEVAVRKKARQGLANTNDQTPTRRRASSRR